MACAAGGASAVKRVVVPIAEEEAEIELGRVPSDVSNQAPGLVGPSASSHVEFIGDRVLLVEHALRQAAERERIAFVLHRESAAPGRC